MAASSLATEVVGSPLVEVRKDASAIVRKSSEK